VPGEVSGMVDQGGWWWGMARMCRGMRTVLWFLCLSDSLLSVMDIFCGVQMPASRKLCWRPCRDRLMLQWIY